MSSAVCVFIRGTYENWEICAVMVILGDLTFLCGCGRLRAKIAITDEVFKDINDLVVYAFRRIRS